METLPRSADGCKRFADLPDDERFRLRSLATDLGAEVAGYFDGDLVLHLPRDLHTRRMIAEALEAAGMKEHEDRWLWAVGTDNPPDDLRHDGLYPGSKGFYLQATFSLATP